VRGEASHDDPRAKIRGDRTVTQRHAAMRSPSAATADSKIIRRVELRDCGVRARYAEARPDAQGQLDRSCGQSALQAFSDAADSVSGV
jgi:hypothetical protein